MIHKSESWTSCDRCGEEIKYMPKLLTFVEGLSQIESTDVDAYANGFVDGKVGLSLCISTSVRKRTIDLCPRCKKEFKRWLNNE